MKHLAALLSVALSLLTFGCKSATHADKPAGARAPARLTEAQRELQVQSFDHVWQTIKDRHWDPNLNGVDWDAAKAELRPRVESAQTADEARAATMALIAKLGQSHFGLIPAETYTEIDEPKEIKEAQAKKAEAAAPADESKPAEGSAPADANKAKPRDDAQVGLAIRPVDGQALITLVQPGSPAEQAGIHAGWIIADIDGREVAPIITRIHDGMKDHPLQVGLITSRSIEGRLEGVEGSEVKLGLLDGNDQRREMTLKRAVPPGKVSKLGNMPAMTVYYDSRRIDGDIAYITFNIFLDPVYLMGEYSKTLQASTDAKGLILDLRGNPGGLGAISMGMGGWLVDEPNQRLGTMISRDSKINFVLNPRPRPYNGPVAVLVDEGSASTTEILAGGLKDLKRARIFGTQTAGAALPSVIEKLPTGDGFQYAIANYVSVGGDELEGRGVTPDETITPDRRALLAGHDAVIDAAVQWIRAQPARNP